MLSFFKDKKSPTLKARVQQFWTWYAKVAPRFHETIERGQCSLLAPEVIAKIDELLPGFAWTFGPGEARNQHSFTLTGEGDFHRQIIARYWLSQAPSLSGWIFYASRQPGRIDGRVIDIGERRFDPIEFWITPDIDRKAEKIDLVAWHPLFDVLAERDRWTILFLFLDEVLGEYGTQQWIGEIKLENNRLTEAIPLKELLPFIQKTEGEAGWKKHPPGKSGTVYEFKKQTEKFIRGDIIIGSTFNMALINDYGAEPCTFVDPLSKFGADYVFVAFDVTFLPQGKESSYRGEIEDELGNLLTASASGEVFGGAYGKKFAYIDLVLFDGKTSLDLVQSALRKMKLPAGTSIRFFSKERERDLLVV